jgi:ribosomal protein S19
MSDYSSIANPFDNNLGRQADMAVVVGPTPDQMLQQTDSYANTNSNLSTQTTGIAAGGSAAGGSVETTAVKSPGAISDVWINTFVRSTNWLPKMCGFTIDGQTGYAEFANVYITGGIIANTGTIGGFNIGVDYMRDIANSMGLASTVTGGDDVRFWSGSTFASRATAPFRVTEAGAVTGSNINITGGSITGAGIVSVVALNLANRGWTQTCVFSITDADTIAWGAGNFVTADGGTTLAISGGNTGNMVSKTYIYLDAGVSLTTYQVTTTATTAVGTSKVLIAIAQNGAVEATYQVLSGQGGQNIDASSIVANSITANELSTSITYAGAIIIDTSGMIRSGQTAYDTGTGWFIGNVATIPKLSIGNSAGNKFTWDGTTIAIVGDITGGSLNINNNAVIDSSGNATFKGVTVLSARAFTIFEATARFSQTNNGTGSITWGTNGTIIDTGATQSSESYLKWTVSAFNTFAGNPTVSIVTSVNTTTADANVRYMGLGDVGNTISLTANHVGFKIVATSLYATQANGSTETASSALTTLSNGDVLDLIFKIHGTTSVDYYWRKNIRAFSSVTTLSTNLPGNTSSAATFVANNAASATDLGMTLWAASYER